MKMMLGSHYLTHAALCKHLKRHLEGVHIAQNARFEDKRPDLGIGKRVLASRGDVIFMHQRVAHCGGSNIGGDMRKMIYFRIRCVEHEEVMRRWADGGELWLGFSGLRGESVDVLV